MKSMQPLSGVLVLDFSTLLPGPLATLMLAEAGAEVIKIERPEGEDMRAMPPRVGGEAAVFAALHIGPGRRFLPWTVSALALGVAFGWLAMWTGNLGGPIAAHFTINFLNLRHIVGAPARPAVA